MTTMPNDLSAFWMPFTDNRGFKAEPRLLARAAGMHYWTPDGRQLLDGTAGLWCVNAGHCRPQIVDAIAQAAGQLDFAPTFQLGHPDVFRLASLVADLTPEGIDHVFFVNSGSEAVDTALKIAFAYHRANGQGERVKLIGRARAYHGVNFGGISVGGIGPNRKLYPVLAGVDHLPHTLNIAEQAFSRGQPAWGGHLADELEAILQVQGPDTVAAVIVEPMAGSTGVLPPPVGYLEKLRAITAKYGILLIFDEVITGFGRLGTPFAAQALGITPDMITMAKGLTNGAVPMGAVASANFIHDTIVNGAAPGIEFFHGYTYSGHPLAAAAGLATLETYAEDKLFERASELAATWGDQVHRLASSKNVIDVRNIGLVAGIELASRPDAVGARGAEIFQRAFDGGLLIRVTGDTLALSPPLIITSEQITELVDGIGSILAEIA